MIEKTGDGESRSALEAQHSAAVSGAKELSETPDKESDTERDTSGGSESEREETEREARRRGKRGRRRESGETGRSKPSEPAATEETAALPGASNEVDASGAGRAREAENDPPFGVGLLDQRAREAAEAQEGYAAQESRAAHEDRPRRGRRRSSRSRSERSEAPSEARGLTNEAPSEDDVTAASADGSSSGGEAPDTASTEGASGAAGKVRRRRASVSARRTRGRAGGKRPDVEGDPPGIASAGVAAGEAEDRAATGDESGGPARDVDTGSPSNASVEASSGEAPESDDSDESGDDAEFVSGPVHREAPARDESPPEESRGRRSKGRRRRAARGRTSQRAGIESKAPDDADGADGAGARGTDAAPEGEGRSPERRGQRRSAKRGSRASARRDDRSDSGQKLVGDAVELPAWVEPAGEGPDLFKRTRRQRRDLMTAGGETAAGETDAEAPSDGERTRTRKRGRFKRILINADDPEEVRIAVAVDGRLEELYYDRPAEKRYLGNIYKGRVVNLEPAIQAAFVDIGIGRNGFLHVSDVLPAYKDSDAVPIDSLSQRLADRRRLRIQEILREGQEILVQISKDAIGAKGPSLTTYVSVPGKFLVLMPGVSRHGVSKRIQDDEDRHDLRRELANLNPPKGMGYIVRTAGHGCSREEFDKDYQYLMKVWDELVGKVRQKRAPTLCYAESDLVIRTMRDLFGPDVDEILVDDPAVYERSRAFCNEVMAEENPRLKLYSGVTPIFTRFGIEEEIEKIYNQKVPLPSGGHIVVEQTEALVAIDVNSGKCRDEEDLEATALKTNLEAAEVIARELRLRDFGGIIINDFIDMERESNRREVERAFRRALKGERAKCWISPISRFGIIEMTRQRVRPSFERDHYEACRCCGGTGVVKTPRSTGMAVLRQARAGLALKRKKTCEIAAHPEVVNYLLNDRRSYLTELEKRYRKTVSVIANPDFSLDQFVIRHF